jgi:hypothetical protein
MPLCFGISTRPGATLLTSRDHPAPRACSRSGFSAWALQRASSRPRPRHCPATTTGRPGFSLALFLNYSYSIPMGQNNTTNFASIHTRDSDNRATPPRPRKLTVKGDETTVHNYNNNPGPSGGVPFTVGVLAGFNKYPCDHHFLYCIKEEARDSETLRPRSINGNDKKKGKIIRGPSTRAQSDVRCSLYRA